MSDVTVVDAGSVAPSVVDPRPYIQSKSAEVKRLRQISNALSMALCGLALVFVALFYSAMTNNFTLEKFRVAVESYGPAVTSPLSDAALDVVAAVVPTYQKELSDKLLKASPRYAQALERELNTFSERIGTIAYHQLELTFRRLFTDKDGSLQAAFPGLSLRPDQIDRIIAANLKNTEKYLTTQMAADVNRLRKTVFAFDDPSLPQSELALSKKMAHNLVMLVDFELSEVK